MSTTSIPQASGPWWRLGPVAGAASPPDAGTAAELVMFGDIGDDPLAPESISAQELVQALAELPEDTRGLTVRLNSYGGSVADGLAIYNALRRHPARVTVTVEGVAISIASLVAMAGDRIEMAENALMMIHAPWAMAVGNAEDMRVAAETLDRYAEAMAASYARASGRAQDDVLGLLTDGADHWYSASEAVAAGFAHTISDAMAAAANIPHRFRSQAMAAHAHGPHAGRRLAGRLNDAIDAIDSNNDDERTRSAVIDQMASEAGIEASTVNSILNAEINCPPLERLEGFARVAGLPSVDEQRSAAESDGCTYDSQGQARLCNPPQPTESNMTSEQLRTRNQQIRAAFRPFQADPGIRDLEAECLADPDMTADQARAKLLDKMGEGVEPANPANYAPHAGSSRVSVRDSADEFRAAVSDAILGRYGVTVSNPHPAAADFANMNIGDLCSTVLSHAGRRPRDDSRAGLVNAALTTSDFPNLLQDVAHKALMTGFSENEAASHRRWTRAGQAEDFREHRRVALSEAPNLSKVPEHGEYEHGALDDAGESIKVDTYGRIVSISRQSLINDELGELARVPASMGQAAARKEADLAYGLLINNPSMRDGVALFDAAHANVATGAALSVDSLGEARQLMRVQRGIKGEATLNLAPTFLIVPAALETDAEKLLASLQPNKAADAVPDWVRQLEVVVDSRLDEDSAKAWYLAASPATIDTIEVARLGGDGAEVMTDEGFDTDTLRFKVRLDVGAAALDWRGLVRNPGA